MPTYHVSLLDFHVLKYCKANALASAEMTLTCAAALSDESEGAFCVITPLNAKLAVVSVDDADADDVDVDERSDEEEEEDDLLDENRAAVEFFDVD